MTTIAVAIVGRAITIWEAIQKRSHEPIYILDPSLESALFKLGLDPEPGGREGHPQSAQKQGQLTDIG